MRQPTRKLAASAARMDENTRGELSLAISRREQDLAQFLPVCFTHMTERYNLKKNVCSRH